MHGLQGLTSRDKQIGLAANDRTMLLDNTDGDGCEDAEKIY